MFRQQPIGHIPQAYLAINYSTKLLHVHTTHVHVYMAMYYMYYLLSFKFMENSELQGLHLKYMYITALTALPAIAVTHITT